MATLPDTFTFGLVLDFLDVDEEGRLSVRDFVHTVEDLREILSQLERSMPDGAEIQWDFDSDPVIRVAAKVNGAAASTLDDVVGRALDAFRETSAEKGKPAALGIPASVHQKIVRVLNRLRQHADIEVTATGREPLIIEHEEKQTRRGSPSIFYEQSVVDGMLEIINIHGSPHFMLFEHGTGRRVRCSLSDERLKNVADSIGKRVVVEGLVKYREDGSPLSIRNVTSVHVITEPEYPLPEVRGSIPGLTGDLPSGEFVRRLRRSDDNGHG